MLLARSLRPGLDATAPGPGLATTAAERLLGRAALGMLLMHQFGDDTRDSVACFAERTLREAEASAMPTASLSSRR